jgi:hypothetical protein
LEPVLLFVVEDSLQIKGRGCILVPGIPPDPGLPAIHVGDSIRLLKPSGDIVDTTIHGVEMINYRGKPPERIMVPISLPRPIAASDVPAGTRVFYLGGRLDGCAIGSAKTAL